jgi:hypothetical protein
MTYREFRSLTKKRTPTEISLNFIKEIDEILGEGFDFGYKQQAFSHIAQCLSHQKADPMIIKSIKCGANLL